MRISFEKESQGGKGRRKGTRGRKRERGRLKLRMYQITAQQLLDLGVIVQPSSAIVDFFYILWRTLYDTQIRTLLIRNQRRVSELVFYSCYVLLPRSARGHRTLDLHSSPYSRFLLTSQSPWYRRATDQQLHIPAKQIHDFLGKRWQEVSTCRHTFTWQAWR